VKAEALTDIQLNDLPEDILNARHEYLTYLVETVEEAEDEASAEIEKNGKYYNLMLNFAHKIMNRISRFYTKLAEYVSLGSLHAYA